MTNIDALKKLEKEDLIKLLIRERDLHAVTKLTLKRVMDAQQAREQSTTWQQAGGAARVAAVLQRAGRTWDSVKEHIENTPLNSVHDSKLDEATFMLALCKAIGGTSAVRPVEAELHKAYDGGDWVTLREITATLTRNGKKYWKAKAYMSYDAPKSQFIAVEIWPEHRRMIVDAGHLVDWDKLDVAQECDIDVLLRKGISAPCRIQEVAPLMPKGATANAA